MSSNEDHFAHRRWRTIRPALELWVFFLAIFGATGLIAHVYDLGSLWFDVLLSLITGAAVVVYCHQDFESLSPWLAWPRWEFRYFLGAFGALLFIGVFDLIYFGLLGVFDTRSDSLLVPFIEQGWPVWSAFVLISLEPGIVEELAFRGQIMSRLEKVLSPNDANIVQASMFSVIHMDPGIFISHFVFGLVMGWLRNYTRSLYPGMLVHAAVNAVVLAMEL